MTTRTRPSRRRAARRPEDQSAAETTPRRRRTARSSSSSSSSSNNSTEEAAPAEPTTPSEAQRRSAAAERLQSEYFALGIGFQWLATSRAFARSDRERAASAVGATADRISASRKLFDRANESWKRLCAMKSQLRKRWEAAGLPYPLAGIRLFPRARFAEWQEIISTARAELETAAQALQNDWPDLIEDARRELGDTFDAADYPADVRGSFAIVTHYPNLTPPEYLRLESPEVFSAEQEAAKARFLDAVTLAESQAIHSLNEMLSNLATRLAGRDEQGRPQQIRESAVENLREFVQWFRGVNVGSSAELDAVVSRVEELASATPESLRNDAAARTAAGNVAAELQSVTAAMLRARPLRKITLAGLKSSANEE